MNGSDERSKSHSVGLMDTTKINLNNQRLVNINRLGNRGKNAISTGSISGSVPYSMGAEASFRPWFQAGMCPSSAMT